MAKNGKRQWVFRVKFPPLPNWKRSTSISSFDIENGAPPKTKQSHTFLLSLSLYGTSNSRSEISSRYKRRPVLIYVSHTT